MSKNSKTKRRSGGGGKKGRASSTSSLSSRCNLIVEATCFGSKEDWIASLLTAIEREDLHLASLLAKDIQWSVWDIQFEGAPDGHFMTSPYVTTWAFACGGPKCLEYFSEMAGRSGQIKAIREALELAMEIYEGHEKLRVVTGERIEAILRGVHRGIEVPDPWFYLPIFLDKPDAMMHTMKILGGIPCHIAVAGALERARAVRARKVVKAIAIGDVQAMLDGVRLMADARKELNLDPFNEDEIGTLFSAALCCGDFVLLAELHRGLTKACNNCHSSIYSVLDSLLRNASAVGISGHCRDERALHESVKICAGYTFASAACYGNFDYMAEVAAELPYLKDAILDGLAEGMALIEQSGLDNLLPTIQVEAPKSSSALRM